MISSVEANPAQIKPSAIERSFAAQQAANATLTPKQRVQAYIDGVLDGTIKVGKKVRRAVERHLWDRQTGDARGLRFDEDAGAHAIDWFGFLTQPKGEWQGEPFILEGWQCFILWVSFGWQRKDSTGKYLRRFRIVYVEVPRKNGKTCWAAGVGLYLFVADDEPGAEVYSAATKRDQARRVHESAVWMVKNSPSLRSRIGIYRDNLHVEKTNSKFEPVGADADTLDGLNVHGAIIDELHAHKTRAMYDVLDTATGSRRQPMLFCITTAGDDITSVCGQLHEHASGVLDGFDKGYEDDGLFGFIASIDEGDDWTNEAVWVKANPNYGISVKPEDLRDKCQRAQKIPSAKSDFLRKHLDVWVEQANPLFNIDEWDKCTAIVDPSALVGRECYGGLDLAKSSDLTAFLLLFPPIEGEELWQVLPWFWMPQMAVENQLPPVQQWANDGLIKVTTTVEDGTDYEFVRAQIVEASKKYRIKQIAFDPWNADSFCQQLQNKDGINVVSFPQVISRFNEPTRALIEDVRLHRAAHGRNPVLRWMATNVTAQEDSNGNLRPIKPERKTKKKIDGIVCWIMARALALAPVDTQSVYGKRDLLVL
jgi:phage terminase large subunit-like protein